MPARVISLPEQLSTDPIDQAAEEWFLRVTAGDMNEAERQRFRQWREADPRHAAAFETMQTLWNGIDTLEPAFALSPGETAALYGQQRRFRRGAAVAIAALAACLLLFVASIPDILVNLRADYRTARGEQASVTLPDGSVAHLNTDSALDVHYTEGRRDVSLLGGEVWFEVARDARRPFSVLALDGRSTAIGTTYAVRERDGVATVTVTEGTVRVTAASTGEAGQLLTAGQRLAYRQDGTAGPVEAVDARAATAWREGIILLRERPFAEALEEIERYRPGRILLLADEENFGPVTARLSLGALDSGIDALAATHGLRVTRLTDYLVILR